MREKLYISLLLLAFTSLQSMEALAQIPLSYYDFARTTLDWYTIETEHFDVIFHMEEDAEGSSRTGQVTARIAEEIYGPITELYGHEPDTKVSIILKDYEDYSNGAAYFFDNKIEIWAPSLDTPLRGDHNWLRNVITHEFTHIVQVQKAMKANRRLPFLYFQLLDYENVRRPDVLYGYPNVIVTYPVTSLNNPAWLAEGTAQYQRVWLDYDQWDTHRDMMLRTRILEDEPLPLADMGGFYSHNSLLRETVYNQGYAFTRYLARRFGEDALRQISEELGKWKNWNVERAIESAVGIPGKDVFLDWVSDLRSEYSDRTAGMAGRQIEGRLLESEGFSNFYPSFSPAGDKVAYVSNRGQDFSQLALYVEDLSNFQVTSVDLLDAQFSQDWTYTCSLGHKIKSGVGRAFSWRPDGEAIVYVRRRDSPEGYYYADLYRYDMKSRKSERLTHEQRATSPAYDASGRSIVFVVQNDGTTNLYSLEIESRAIVQLTSFYDGSQASDPVWDPSGEWIYFSLQRDAGRDIYRIRADGSGMEAVFDSAADERDPVLDTDGAYLYYASDETGIYNIYRVSLGGEASPQQITNVLGGAFMPAVHDNRLVFARYDHDGYKIAMIDDIQPVPEADRLLDYHVPAVLGKPDSAPSVDERALALNTFDDSDITPLTASAPADPSGDESGLSYRPYRNQFTSFSFYPVLRLDQYVSRRQRTLDVRLADRGRLETLLRNTKVGVLMSSREILEGMNIFAGVMVGPTSRDASSVGDFFAPARLLKLERDMFFQFDYSRGLGFIPRRWSPQLSLEVFNIRRNVDKGLSVEEFPCTACYPDTTLADLSYNLWEASLTARSKVTRHVMLEATYRYSPYSVTTERFFSKEADQAIDAFSSRYYIGNAFLFKSYFEWLAPHRHSDVVPEGLRFEASYEREVGRLLDRFDLENGILRPVYERDTIHRLTFDSRFGMRLPGTIFKAPHGIGVRARASTVVGRSVDDFFNDYVGGLVGARGYPFYAMGGNETLWLQASYLLPIVPRIRKQLMFTYIDKLYGRLYADAAAAWNGTLSDISPFRTDVGAELRLGLGSFYLLPTALFVSATYGLDSFDFRLGEGFLTPDGQNTVHYGQSWQWHFGVLFGFDL